MTKIYSIPRLSPYEGGGGNFCGSVAKGYNGIGVKKRKGWHMSHFRKILFLFPATLSFLTGCQPNYFLLHPLEPVPDIYRETEFFDRGQLRVHCLARYPDRPGKLPAVPVHPDRGSLSKDMEGISLA